jgi:hypothetical protein
MADMDALQSLVDRPRESLNAEIKGWLDLGNPPDQAKMIKACLAMRNNNGGFIILGFDNDTLQPSREGRPADVATAYHADRIQRLASNYVSKMDQFEVTLELRISESDGREYPIIIIPSGVKTPVVSVRDLNFESKTLLRERTIYVRTTRSNSTVSTAEARAEDMPSLIDRCMDNREADIGRFLRRHLSGPQLQGFSDQTLRLLSSSTDSGTPTATDAALQRIMEEGRTHLDAQLARRELDDGGNGFWEVAANLHPSAVRHRPNKDFLDLLIANNPRLTGWPKWIDTRGFQDRQSHPMVLDGYWQALVAPNPVRGNEITFWRAHPSGCFYHWETLDDDSGRGEVKPGKYLDYALVIWRVTEAMAVALSFGRALTDSRNGVIGFLIRWSRLEGRVLTSWANPRRYIDSGVAHQDTFDSRADVPLDTAPSSLHQYVQQVVAPLFEIFEGVSLGNASYEYLVDEILNRKSR